MATSSNHTLDAQVPHLNLNPVEQASNMNSLEIRRSTRTRIRNLERDYVYANGTSSQSTTGISSPISRAGPQSFKNKSSKEELKKKEEERRAGIEQAALTHTKIKSLLETPSVVAFNKNVSAFKRPQKLVSSLLDPYVDRKDVRIVEKLKDNKDLHLMEETRQMLLTLASQVKFIPLKVASSPQMKIFFMERHPRVVTGLIKLDPSEDIAPQKSSADTESSFRVIKGKVLFDIEMDKRDRKCKKNEEIHVRPGLGFALRNASDLSHSFLYFRFRKIQVVI